MSISCFSAIKTTGGTAGTLDDIIHTNITDGDMAIVVDAVNNISYHYTYDSSSSTSESDPVVIRPDSNSGNGRWLLTKVESASLEILSGTLQLPNGTSINEFSIDGTLAGDSDDAVPTEKAVKSYVGTYGLLAASIPGFRIRPNFIWKDVDEIYINSFTYHHQGTSEQMVYCDSQLTYTFINLAASDWSYLYLDDSAIVTAGTGLIAVGQLIDSVTEPTWSAAKHGWYNGDDRCIFAVLTDGSSNILEFFHDGDLVLFANLIGDLASTDIDTSWTDVTLTRPSFATKVYLHFNLIYFDGTTYSFWRTNGQAGTIGHRYGYVNAGILQTRTIWNVITDSDGIIEIKHDAANANQSRIENSGWYFPIGM